MGDNRNNSEDSRAFGALKKEFIVGQALLIYWPPTRMKVLMPREYAAEWLRRHLVRPCTPRRHPSPRRIRCRRLRLGAPAAHETADVPLLPSGSGGVGQISLRRTQPSLLRAPAGS